MIEKRFISPHLQLAILHLEGYAQANPTLSKRQLEKDGLQLLLKALFPEAAPDLLYTTQGKPYLSGNHGYISVSHSHAYMAVLHNSKEETGVDIELIRDKVFRIKHKFCSEEELQFAGEDEQALITLWAVKEALYKVDGLKELDFKTQLKVMPYTNPDFIEAGILRTNQERKFVLVAEKLHNYILVYVLHEVY